jgi:phosphomannomutase
MKILVLNSGSSSLKACLYEIGDTLPESPPLPLWDGRIEWNGDTAAITVRNLKGVSRKEKLQISSRKTLLIDLLATPCSLELTAEFGSPLYTRIDAPASAEQKRKLQKLSTDSVKESQLAGEPIVAKLTKAPGNNSPIGGLKVVTGIGWFAARPSGTENIYKIYAESFKDESHLKLIIREAQEIVSNALGQS